MVHEIWLFKLVHILIGRSLYASTLFAMVVDICNADLTYSVKQLTTSCVDETSVHFGFMVDNDYDIRFLGV